MHRFSNEKVGISPIYSTLNLERFSDNKVGINLIYSKLDLEIWTIKTESHNRPSFTRMFTSIVTLDLHLWRSSTSHYVGHSWYMPTSIRTLDLRPMRVKHSSHYVRHSWCMPTMLHHHDGCRCPGAYLGARPSAITMLTGLWLYCHMSLCVTQILMA